MTKAPGMRSVVTQKHLDRIMERVQKRFPTANVWVEEPTVIADQHTVYCIEITVSGSLHIRWNELDDMFSDVAEQSLDYAIDEFLGEGQ